MVIAKYTAIIASIACLGCATAPLPAAIPEEPVSFTMVGNGVPPFEVSIVEPPPAMVETSPAPLHYTPLKATKRLGTFKRPVQVLPQDTVPRPQSLPESMQRAPRLGPVSLPANGQAQLGQLPMPKLHTFEEEFSQPLPKTRRTPREAPARSNTAQFVQPQRVGSNGLVRYVWQEERQYLVTTAPDHPVTLYLPPGEKLEAGVPVDPLKFETGYAKQGGKGETQAQLVVLRPTQPGLDVSTTIVTNARSYYLRLKSVEQASMLGVKWMIPEAEGEEESALPPTNNEVPELPGMPHFDVRRLHTGYDVKATKGSPPWMPTSIFDDGTRTVIRFARSLGFTDAPAVFALQANQTPAMVEWTPWEVPNQPDQPSYYTIANIWPRLLLKTADAEVTITRQAALRRPYQPVAGR